MTNPPPSPAIQPQIARTIHTRRKDNTPEPLMPHSAPRNKQRAGTPPGPPATCGMPRCPQPITEIRILDSHSWEGLLCANVGQSSPMDVGLDDSGAPERVTRELLLDTGLREADASLSALAGSHTARLTR
jgi:hypothetical protein